MRKLVFALTTLGLLMCGACFAETLYTSGLFDEDPNAFFCVVTNITASPISVTVTIYKHDGTVFSGPSVVNLAANETNTMGFQFPVTPAGFSCKFSTASNKSTIRGHAEVREEPGNHTLALTEAR